MARANRRKVGLTYNLDLRLPEYEAPWLSLIDEAACAGVQADPMLGQVPRIKTVHAGPVRSVRGEHPFDAPMAEIRVEAELGRDEVRQGNVATHTLFLSDLGRSYLETAAPQFIDTVSGMLDAAGQTINHRGRPLSWDVFLDALEKLVLVFDDEGNPQLPTLYVPPALAASLRRTPWTLEQELRRDRIIRTKREEYYAAKRYRRLR